MKKILAAVFCLFCFFVAVADESGAVIRPEAGFYSIESISYSFHDKWYHTMNFNTTKSNIFFSYQPADNDPEFEKPLFVMLNGGPGAATVTNLFAMNTAPYTLDREHQKEGSPGYSINQYSWTNIGHLLYIDAPDTGFSYLEDPDSSWTTQRIARFFFKGNFNPFIDAAQVLRVVLRFLADHPQLKANPVVLVGESYGGTRVSTMLNLLYFHKFYTTSGDRVFRDDSLAQEIENHFKDIYGQDTEVTPQVAAKQFGRQILIQPELAGVYQDEVTGVMFYGEPPYYDTVITDLAKETGQKFPTFWEDPLYCLKGTKSECVIMFYVPSRFKRDRYNYSKGKTWSDDLEAYSAKSLRDYDALSTILGCDVGHIEKIAAKERADAFKLIAGHTRGGAGSFGYEYATDADWFADPDNEMYLPSDPGSRARLLGHIASQQYMDSFDYGSNTNHLWDRLGNLKRYDKYMLEMNYTVWAAFTSGVSYESRYDIHPDKSLAYGRMFLENLALAKTFLTDAEYDLVIYSPAIPEALKKYDDVVKDVTCMRGKEFNDKTRGAFRIEYVPKSLEHTSTPDYVDLYYPYYADSGHSVSSAEPKKLLNDVTNWLAEGQTK